MLIVGSLARIPGRESVSLILLGSLSMQLGFSRAFLKPRHEWLQHRDRGFSFFVFFFLPMSHSRYATNQIGSSPG